MSTPEPQQEREQRTSVKVTRNAKGDAQFEWKILTGEDDAVVDALRHQAVRQYRLTADELDGTREP